MPRTSQTLTVTIERPARAVYDFLRTPQNLPQWASGLADEVTFEGGRWVGTSDFGRMAFEFVAENDFLIADHLVTLPDGAQTNNPVRVLPNDDGAEVVFTVLREPEQDDETWDTVLRTVDGDLDRLRRVLETPPAG